MDIIELVLVYPIAMCDLDKFVNEKLYTKYFGLDPLE